MKKAFTMIELIFVIVIIGILAVIAIPKLSATRDDAKAVTELANIKTCINDIADSYIAVGEESNSSSSCKSLECITIDLGSNTKDGNFSINFINPYPKPFCQRVKEIYDKKNPSTNFSFGGSKIKF